MEVAFSDSSHLWEGGREREGDVYVLGLLG